MTFAEPLLILFVVSSGRRSWQEVRRLAVFRQLPEAAVGDDRFYGGADADDDLAHFSDEPVAPRYDVRDMGSYIVVYDTWSEDGRDIVREIPLENLHGPYGP